LRPLHVLEDLKVVEGSVLLDHVGQNLSFP
jgi:hypothetical protein